MVIGVDVFDNFLYPSTIKRGNASATRELRMCELAICERTALAAVVTADVDVVCHLAALECMIRAIANHEPVQIYWNSARRDYTYIDDVVGAPSLRSN
jgi:nucleoside-diphosphate-sugar epimerase